MTHVRTDPSRRSLAGIRRSVRLLRAFAREQSAPEVFYSLLGTDSVRMIEQHQALAGRTVLDVGAGPPEFGAAFTEAGARYVAVDSDRAALAVRERASGVRLVVARGERLPFADGSVDVCFSSNVLEHVPRPWALADELTRVVRPGGLVVVSYTNWLSPWGGHETSPWHYLGGYVAADRYGRRYGHLPKNRYGIDLFPVSVAAGLRWARNRSDIELLEARPRYLPPKARWVLAAAGLREVVTWNLWMVMRRL